MKKIDKILDYFETGSFIVLLSVMTIVVFLQVIYRYILHASLSWSEEVSRYCMIYTVFIGVGAGLKAGTHTGVDALVMVLPKKLKEIVILIERIICLLLSVVFFVLSAELVMQLVCYIIYFIDCSYSNRPSFGVCVGWICISGDCFVRFAEYSDSTEIFYRNRFIYTYGNTIFYDKWSSYE